MLNWLSFRRPSPPPPPRPSSARLASALALRRAALHPASGVTVSEGGYPPPGRWRALPGGVARPPWWEPHWTLGTAPTYRRPPAGPAPTGPDDSDASGANSPRDYPAPPPEADAHVAETERSMRAQSNAGVAESIEGHASHPPTVLQNVGGCGCALLAGCRGSSS